MAAYRFATGWTPPFILLSLQKLRYSTLFDEFKVTDKTRPEKHLISPIDMLQFFAWEFFTLVTKLNFVVSK